MSSTLNPYFYAYTPELLAFENAWVNFIKNGEINHTIIKPEIADSWIRSREFILDPLSIDPLKIVGKEDLSERKRKNKDIIEIVVPFIEMLKDGLYSTGFGILFSDADGVILDLAYPEINIPMYEKLNLSVGSIMSEEYLGTNAIGLCLKLKKPIQVSGAENYIQGFQRFSISAAPIVDENEELLGVLALIGRYEQIHKHTLGIAVATAEAIRNKIQILQINKKLIENNKQLRTTLNIVTDGLVYINEGKIVQLNHEMCEILGKSQEELIGKNAEEEIITTPELHELLNKDYSKQIERQIILKGSSRNYQCLFELRNLDEKDGNENAKVMKFTRTEEISQLASKIKYLAKYHFSDIVGQSAAIRDAISLAKKAAEYDARILIEGESGTGKEMFAQSIHNNSRRKDGPFIAVDCVTTPKELFESHFFGYEQGAFTGARKEGQAGIFELANKGTVFLDEVGNMPVEMQNKLLRVLQEGEFVRVGGTKPIKTDVRIIAATNADLREEVEKGNFRHDLYYRLNVFYIRTPALRERKEDIPLLVDHFINRLKFTAVTIDKNVLEALQNYSWPGNARQLYNTIERALIMSKNGHITLNDLPMDIVGLKTGIDNFMLTGAMTLDEVTAEYVKYALGICDNNVSKAAKLLKVSRSTVYKLLKEG